MKLTDVRLLVERFDECFDFYSKVMGLELVVRVPENVYAEFRAGDGTVALYQRRLMDEVVGADPRGEGPRRGDQAALIFLVENVDDAVREFKGRGASFITEPHDQSTWGLRVAHLRDPEGNLIELYHRLPDA